MQFRFSFTLAVFSLLIFLEGSLFAQVNLIRGPYIQQSTTSSIIIHWRTDSACNSKVFYGPSAGVFADSLTDNNVSTEHIVKISGLNASSKYYYTIGYGNTKFFSSDPDFFFYTHPPAGSTGHYRFWVIGDAGMGDNNQRDVRNSFFQRVGNTKMDGWIWLGDNAYNSGFDSEYQSAVFSNNTYENILPHLVAWAAPGNHDYAQNESNPAPDFLDIFDFPGNGESGGLASGTEKYFSWNYGNIHFVQLDSYGSDRSYTGPQAQWLRNDLQQNNLTWVIAYFHHPPYTKGNHNSDDPGGSDPELPQIRNGLIKVLEEEGIDLVLSGHSHVYERSSLIDGHYGNSVSLHDSMMVDSTSGSYPGDCAYKKDSIGGKGHKGTVYAVVGVSGKITGIQSDWPHPVMYKSIAYELGSMLLEVHENKLKATFINSLGATRDSFTIIKNMRIRKQIFTCKDSALVLQPTWHEKANWWPFGMISQTLTIYPNSDTVIVARDQTTCLTDTFEIHIVPDSVCDAVGIKKEVFGLRSFTLYPNPSSGKVTIRSYAPCEELSVEIKDLLGKSVCNLAFNSGKEFVADLSAFKDGVYIFYISDRRSKQFQAIKYILQR